MFQEWKQKGSENNGAKIVEQPQTQIHTPTRNLYWMILSPELL